MNKTFREMNDKNEAVQGTDCSMRKETKMHFEKKTFLM